ncbi:hypothetical protein BDZ85DRAFT_255654 [Elsinoe ampelina]|uniref:PH domain-containing protein n=1 Tax=Elsinoe ampelina TaxID=302913 RepID=A0A6A6GR64_9PEZI|nr:hypothetical protein BDZ85DRAFT_255654 [Elsinoe ampelina]
MFIDDSSTRQFPPSLDVKHEITVQELLNKPLPPLRHLNATPDLDPTITATPGFDRPSGPGRHLNEQASKMSLFHLFSRPKVERSRGYAEAGLQTPSPLEQPELRASRRESRGDLKGARLEKAIPGSPRDNSRPRAPIVSRPKDPNRQPRPNAEAFDLLHPPPFKKIFSIAVKIGPAHTCLMNGAKGTPAWKVGSALTLNDFEQYDRPSSRRSSRMPPQPTPQLQRKIFSLTKNGYILQYADRGSSDRLPERLQRLTKDTCAIASDLVPGKPYTVQVAESTSVQEVARPDSPSFFSRLGMKPSQPKKQIPSTLIVLDTAKELEEWLFAIRKEIQRQSRPSPTSSPPRARTPPTESLLTGSITPRAMEIQKDYGFPAPAVDRMDSPRESLQINRDPPTAKEYGSNSTFRGEELTYDPRISEVPTATQMYHRQVMLARQGSESGAALSTEGHKRRSLHSLRAPDQSPDRASPTAAASPSLGITDRKTSVERSRPFTPTSAVKTPTGLRQLENAEIEGNGPPRKDSLMKSPELPTGFLSDREAAHVARMRKRASHQGPSPVTQQERPELRSVSSLGRLKSGQPVPDNQSPMPPPAPLVDTYGSPAKLLSTGRVATRKMDNDEYHAFQLSMSSEPNPPSATLSGRRRHSAMPSQSSFTSTTSNAPSAFTQPHFVQRNEPAHRVLARDDTGTSSTPKNLPPRLPFKLRGVPPQVDLQRVIAHQKQPSPPSTSYGAGHSPSDSPLQQPKLRRPTSMQVRPNPAPFLNTMRSASNNPPPDTRILATERKPFLRPSRSDYSIPSTARAQPHRPLRPPEDIAEDLSDDEGMFIIQGAAQQPLPETLSEGPLPPPDLGMPLVALGPPPPPPETPLPRLPPMPMMVNSRPNTPLTGH